MTTERKYTNEDIENIITDLNHLFVSACQQYQKTLEKRDSNRAKKEILKGNLRGTNLHKYESDFAWLLHEIKTGPYCLIEDKVTEAHNLISHIKTISNN